MKLYNERMTYGPSGPRLLMIGFKLQNPYSIYFCIWKWIFYFGIKK